ncbi:MAG: hypothetical protein JNM00_09515 [Flavobacteriales bacterium]|nr:hypothetical protein [Flavobacteriales bacterium]
MSIIDIFILFTNEIQDMGYRFENASIIVMQDGTQVNADSTMTNLQWEWAVIMPDSTGKMTKTVIAQTFDLIIAQVADSLKNGEFRLQLSAKDTTTGKVWSRIIPAFLQHELVSGTWPNYMPYPEMLTAEQYRQQAYSHTQIGPRDPGQDFKHGKIGDLNGDGANNTNDLMLFLTYFGE